MNGWGLDEDSNANTPFVLLNCLLSFVLSKSTCCYFRSTFKFLLGIEIGSRGACLGWQSPFWPGVGLLGVQWRGGRGEQCRKPEEAELPTSEPGVTQEIGGMWGRQGVI